MAQVGLDLSQRLRNPNGEHQCDLIIALTHARFVTYTVCLHLFAYAEEPVYQT